MKFSYPEIDPNRSYLSCCNNPSLWLSIPWQETRLNPLAGPKGYPEEQWLPETIDLFARGELLHSRHLLAARLDDLVHKARLAAGVAGPASPAGAAASYTPPSLYGLRDNLLYQKCRPASREDQYRQSALNVLDGRLRTSASVYDCAVGMEALLTDTRARVSTEGLAPLETLDFFINNLVHYVYRKRCVEPLLEPPELHTLVLVEEAQTLLRPRDSASAIPFYQEMLLRARSLGVGFMFVAQDISHVDSLVLAGCSNYFIFAQSTADNKKAAQNMLNLSPREAGLLGALETGECFVRFTGHSRFSYPFIARIPRD